MVVVGRNPFLGEAGEERGAEASEARREETGGRIDPGPLQEALHLPVTPAADPQRTTLTPRLCSRHVSEVRIQSMQHTLQRLPFLVPGLPCGILPGLSGEVRPAELVRPRKGSIVREGVGDPRAGEVRPEHVPHHALPACRRDLVQDGALRRCRVHPGPLPVDGPAGLIAVDTLPRTNGTQDARPRLPDERCGDLQEARDLPLAHGEAEAEGKAVPDLPVREVQAVLREDDIRKNLWAESGLAEEPRDGPRHLFPARPAPVSGDGPPGHGGLRREDDILRDSRP